MCEDFRRSRRTESIATILKQSPYIDLFILTFGDNHFFDPESGRTEMPKLVTPILQAGAACAFVTPTEGVGRFADKRSLINNIKRSLESLRTRNGKSCSLIDSFTVGGDVLKSNADLVLMRDAVSADPMGLHPQGNGARLWAERVFDALIRRGLLDRLN